MLLFSDKMKKETVNLFCLIFPVVMGACGKSDKPAPVVPDPPITVTDTLKQYSTPFANVTAAPDAVIYQVNMRVFSPQGNLDGVTARLDAIKDLGANVVYLMPVYPVGTLKSVNSPYCVKDYTSIDPAFGTLANLRQLVEEAHRRNMSVIMDWVGNHTAWDHTWMSTHKDWYAQDAAGNVISPPGTGWNDVAQLDYKNAAMRLAMIRAMKYWVLAANIDGYRCDYTDGPPVDFWKQAIDTLRNISTHKLLMLAEGSRNTNFTAGFNYNFGFGYFNTLKNVFNGQPATAIDSVNNSEYLLSGDEQRLVHYISNHDVNGADGTPQELFGGDKGAMAAFVVTAMMKSVPMIYNGQEVGTPIRLTFPFTTTKIDWTLHPELTATYKKLISIRTESPAIRRGQLTTYSNADICAFTRTINSSEVLVVVNLRNKALGYTLPAALQQTTWQDAVKGVATNLQKEIPLSPYAYYIFSR